MSLNWLLGKNQNRPSLPSERAGISVKLVKFIASLDDEGRANALPYLMISSRLDNSTFLTRFQPLLIGCPVGPVNCSHRPPYSKV